MFVCDLCKTPVGFAVEEDKDGEKRIRPPQPVRLVVASRDKVYRSRVYTKGEVSVIDPGGVGSEIVREVNACKTCARARGTS